MNYMKLIKLLYLTDRGAFLKWGRPVSGDEYYSMKLGPVLSEVKNLITEEQYPDKQTYWSQHISAPTNFSVTLSVQPSDDELSRAELKLIREIFAAYGNYAPLDLVNLLHNVLPEWTEVSKGRVPIEYRDILRAGNIPDDETKAIESELDNVSMLESLIRVA